jgi:hypothetical protein
LREINDVDFIILIICKVCMEKKSHWELSKLFIDHLLEERPEDTDTAFRLIEDMLTNSSAPHEAESIYAT